MREFEEAIRGTSLKNKLVPVDQKSVSRYDLEGCRRQCCKILSNSSNILLSLSLKAHHQHLSIKKRKF